MGQQSKKIAKLVLLISFFIGLIDRIISHILFIELSKEDYEQFYYNMVGFEMLLYSCMMLIYAFLFNLCKLTKTAIMANTAFCVLDLISTVFNTGDILNDVVSLIITIISSFFIIAEILLYKITKNDRKNT